MLQLTVSTDLLYWLFYIILSANCQKIFKKSHYNLPEPKVCLLIVAHCLQPTVLKPMRKLEKQQVPASQMVEFAAFLYLIWELSRIARPITTALRSKVCLLHTYIPWIGEKNAMGCLHFFKPITIVLGGVKLWSQRWLLCKMVLGWNLFWWNICTLQKLTVHTIQ